MSLEDFCVNASIENITEEWWQVEDKLAGYITAAILLLFLVVGLPWNLMLIVTIFKRKLYHRPTLLLLLNLATIDTLWLVLLTPLQVLTAIKGEFFLGDSDSVRCSVCSIGVIPTLFAISSLFTITLISMDRFLFIYKPFYYERRLNSCRIVVAVIIMWILALLIALLPFMGFGSFHFDSPYLTCSADSTLVTDYYVVLLLSICLLAAVAMIVTNTWLCCIVHKNIRAIYHVRKAQVSTAGGEDLYKSKKKLLHEKEWHMVKVFGALLASYVVIWLLLIILSLVVVYGGESATSTSPIIGHIIFQSQTVVHPIIETVIIKDVRVPLEKLCLCCCARFKAEASPDKKMRLPAKVESCWKKCSVYYELWREAVHYHDPHPSSPHNHKQEMQETEKPQQTETVV